MTIWWKLSIVCVIIVSIFGAGVFAEKKMNLAAQATSAYAALTQAQKGEMAIIKDQQQLERNYAKHKDPCDNAFVPADDSRVLH